MGVADGLGSFLARDWAAVRAAKERYWDEELTAADRVRLAEELRLSVLARVPAWPAEGDRLDDLAAHVRLAARLRDADPPRAR